MKRLPALRALAAALALLGVARPCFAVGPIGVGTPIEQPHPPLTGLEPGNKRGYWARGNFRPFVSSVVDAGFLYLRPSIAAGWGKPHWHFAEAEGYAAFSGNGIGQYLGVRVALPHVEIRGGARYQLTLDRSFLARADSYDRFALEERELPRSRYLALESELVATAPIGYGSVFGLFSGYLIRGVPDGVDVYEEQLRVVVRPASVFRGRIGYSLRLGHDGAVRIGPVAELILIPERSAEIFRGGVVATVVLNPFLEVLASFVPVWFSPDTIGLAGGDFAQLGIRYRYASSR